MAIDFGPVLNTIFGIISLLAKIILSIAGGVGVAALGWWYLHWKKYDTIARIYEIDEFNKLIEKERVKAGIFMDRKTKYRLLKLKGKRVGLTPDKIPYINSTSKFKVVNVLRTGLKSYRYLGQPSITTNSPINIDYGVHDYDVAWATNEIEKGNVYIKIPLIEKMMPFMGMAFVFLVVTVALYYMIVKAGFNADLVRELAKSATVISENMAKASLGTTVVGG